MVDFRGLGFTGAANPQLAVFFLCALQKCFHVSNHKIFTIISFEEKKHIPLYPISRKSLLMYSLSDLFQFKPRQTGNCSSFQIQMFVHICLLNMISKHCCQMQKCCIVLVFFLAQKVNRFDVSSMGRIDLHVLSGFRIKDLYHVNNLRYYVWLRLY